MLNTKTRINMAICWLAVAYWEQSNLTEREFIDEIQFELAYKIDFGKIQYKGEVK